MNIKSLALCALLFLGVLAPSPSSAAWTIPDELCISQEVSYAGEASAIADMRALSERFDLRWWDTSPSCRYALLSFLTPEGGEHQRLFVLWDLQTGQRRIEYMRPHDFREVPYLVWRADESEVVIGGFWDSIYPYADSPHGVFHLFNLNTGRADVLHCAPLADCITDPHLGFTWDDARNWLWSNGIDGIIAYDRSTGSAVYSFFSPPWARELDGYPAWRSYFFSADFSRIVIYHIPGSGLHAGATVWDIDRRAAFPVNVEGYIRSNDTIALSPDNRYLVIGDTAIRVWDLDNLTTAYEDRLPIHRHAASDARINALRFLSTTIIETRNDLGITECWHVESGAQIPCPA